jgi:thioredoxin 1
MKALLLAALFTGPAEGVLTAPPPGAMGFAKETESEQPIGLYVYADWCGPCKATSPIVKTLQYEGASIELVNADEHPEIVAKYRVTGLPAFIRFHEDGRRFYRKQGQLNAAQIAEHYGVSQQVGVTEAPKSKSRSPQSEGSDPPVAAVVKIGADFARGSGVIIGRTGNKYRAITNSHVVRAGWPHAVIVNGTEYPATALKHDRETDVAVLEFEYAGELAVAEIADSPPPDRSQATTHGHPRGGDRRDQRTLIDVDYFSDAYYSAAGFINGESGGPVFVGGKVVGLISASNGADGVVVRLDQIKALLEGT